MSSVIRYCTRLAPSPTGYLHLGHARTFWLAWHRCRMMQGRLVFRNEDLDGSRCKREFIEAAAEDIQWLGLDWDVGPASQSVRTPIYRIYLEKLKAMDLVYPCYCSRKDILEAVSAPHEVGDEPIYPGTCRNGVTAEKKSGREPCWRFRVPEGEEISFEDHYYGKTKFVPGVDFGDFVIWRQDDIPSYQLAIVVDDFLMGVTEVVRGEDLLRSTARQLLISRALGWKSPQYLHCPLVKDEEGNRLAKRHKSLSLRDLRHQGVRPKELLEKFEKESSQWDLTAARIGNE